MTLLHHFCPFKSWQCNRSSGSGEAQEVEELEVKHLLHASQPESTGQDNLTWVLASTHYHSLPLGAAQKQGETCSSQAPVVKMPAWQRHTPATFGKGLPFSKLSIL